MELTTRGSLQLISKQQSSGSLGMFSIGSKRIGLGLLLRWNGRSVRDVKIVAPVPGQLMSCRAQDSGGRARASRNRREGASGTWTAARTVLVDTRRNERSPWAGFFSLSTARTGPVYNRTRLSHGTLKRLASWPIRDPRASRGGRHGRGLPGEG